MSGELEFYKEHIAHGRHIETQRSAVAALSAAFSATIIGALLQKGSLTPAAYPYTVTLVFVNAVALLLSAKFYERFKLHNAIAAKARDVYDINLKSLRHKAEQEHADKFPVLFRIKLHVVWQILFGLLCLIGLILTLLVHRPVDVVHPAVSSTKTAISANRNAQLSIALLRTSATRFVRA